MYEEAVLIGLGGWVPPGIVSNDDLATHLNTSDEWITSRTGIKERHVVGVDYSTSDLAVRAGQRALVSAGLRSVDYVIVATTTPDRLCPATAPEVSTRLGMKDTPAFDVSAVCSGFLYALQIGRALIKSGAGGTVLVIGAETFTTLLDPQDRNTRPIFGDGAGAVVLRGGDANEPGALVMIELHSDGALSELITVDGGGAKARATGSNAPAHLYMRGRSTFMEAIRHMEDVTTRVVEDSGWDLASVDYIVGHQANARILSALAGRLGLAEESAIINITELGNTAGASIPLALVFGNQSGLLTEGKRVVMPTFGAGATWGAATLTWPDLKTISYFDKPRSRDASANRAEAVILSGTG